MDKPAAAQQVMDMAPLPAVYVMGSKLSLCSLDALLQRLRSWIESKTSAMILYGNLHSLNVAYEHLWLRHFVNQADVVLVDGEGARWAAWLALRLQGHTTVSLPARSTWADLGWELAAFCAQHQYSLYLLGSAAGTAKRAAVALQAKHPQLKIVGTQHGYFDMLPGSPDNQAVLDRICAARPDILIIGLGIPLQEEWLLHNRSQLPPCICWCAGAAFDYLSGDLPRGPQWMTAHGLEWMARLLVQPRRLWRRYLVGLPLFWLRFLHCLSRGRV